MVGSKKYQLSLNQSVCEVLISDDVVFDEAFQLNLDQDIAKLSEKKVKLLIIIPGIYSVSRELRQKMMLLGGNAPVCAVALLNKDGKWNEFNDFQTEKKKPMFPVKFFSEKEEAMDWLRSVSC